MDNRIARVNSILETPIGNCFVEASTHGLTRCLVIKNASQEQGLVSLSGDRMAEHYVAKAKAALESFFGGELEALSKVKLAPYASGTIFQQSVWDLLQTIKPGNTLTYGEAAKRLGMPHGARAVGRACGANQLILFVPCHRMVAAKSLLGGFAAGTEVKSFLLHHENSSII